MSLLRRARGFSLLTRFGVASLVLTIAVGFVLSSVLSTAITERARQGYQFARPMPAAQLSDLLAAVGTIHDAEVPAGS